MGSFELAEYNGFEQFVSNTPQELEEVKGNSLASIFITKTDVDAVPQGSDALTSYLKVEPPNGKEAIVTILPASDPVASTSTHVPPRSCEPSKPVNKSTVNPVVKTISGPGVFPDFAAFVTLKKAIGAFEI